MRVQMRNRFPCVGAVPGGPAMRIRSTVLGAGLGALVRDVPFLFLFDNELNMISWLTISSP